MPALTRKILFIPGILTGRGLVISRTCFRPLQTLPIAFQENRRGQDNMEAAEIPVRRLHAHAIGSRRETPNNAETSGLTAGELQTESIEDSKHTKIVSPAYFHGPQPTGRVEPFPYSLFQTTKHETSSANLADLEASDKQSPGSVAAAELDTTSPRIRDSGRVIPHIFDTVELLRAYRREAAQKSHLVGFVPTMGALHEGHLNLMREAARDCNEVWVSIYVNPTQFGANEDFSTYPSTWEADLEKINKLNDELLAKGHSRVSAVFRPRTPEILYPYGLEGTSHIIINPELTQILEGSSRKTFFRGVTTVVMKLLNIVQPDRVYFGQKDIQQFAVIKRMIKEFHLPVQICRVPTTREASGLAMSSRNAYLGKRRREAATLLHHMLTAAKQAFVSSSPSDRTRQALLDAAMKVYNDKKEPQEERANSPPSTAVQFRLDYLSLADPDSLQEIDDKVGPRGAIMSLAVYFEPLRADTIQAGEELGINNDSTTVRLIDNELLGVDEPDRDVF